MQKRAGISQFLGDESFLFKVRRWLILISGAAPPPVAGSKKWEKVKRKIVKLTKDEKKMAEHISVMTV